MTKMRDRLVAGLIVGAVAIVTLGGYLWLQSTIPPAPAGPPPTTQVNQSAGSDHVR